MGKYKLLALDMDGTLLNEMSEVSEENAYWVQKALDEGIIVSLSTGRGFLSAYPFAEQLKLDTPMITVNGGEVWEHPQKLHKRTLLAAEHVRRLHELALSFEEPWFWAYTTEGIYNKEKWIPGHNDYEQHEWLKFGYYTENDESRNKILQTVSSWNLFEITNSSPHNLEINPKGISKASALQELCLLLGISMSEVVAVGDSLNDIAAIQAAGLGVAMGNAQEEVKAAADVVTLTNNEHGVAEVIRSYVLRG